MALALLRQLLLGALFLDAFAHEVAQRWFVEAFRGALLPKKQRVKNASRSALLTPRSLALSWHVWRMRRASNFETLVFASRAAGGFVCVCATQVVVAPQNRRPAPNTALARRPNVLTFGVNLKPLSIAMFWFMSAPMWNPRKLSTYWRKLAPWRNPVNHPLCASRSNGASSPRTARSRERARGLVPTAEIASINYFPAAALIFAS